MPGSGRPLIEGDDFSLIRLETDEEFLHEKIQLFDCGKKDLTDFFRNDALPHHKELLATTYFLQPKTWATDRNIFYPLALVSFLNDSLRVEKTETATSCSTYLKKIKKLVPYPKRGYKSFPAVKIGRLGVLTSYRGKDFGTALINLTKEFFVTNNKTGCRFLTVDAYNDPEEKSEKYPIGRTVHFYQKNGFEFLSSEDENEKTRIMWFDLKTFKKNTTP